MYLFKRSWLDCSLAYVRNNTLRAMLLYMLNNPRRGSVMQPRDVKQLRVDPKCHHFKDYTFLFVKQRHVFFYLFIIM